MGNKDTARILKLHFVIIVVLMLGFTYLLVENIYMRNEQENIDNILEEEKNRKDGIEMSLIDVHRCGIDYSPGWCFDIIIWNKNTDVTIGPNALYILGRSLDQNKTLYYQMDIQITAIIEPDMEKEYKDRHLIIPGYIEDGQVKTPGCYLEVYLFYNGEPIEEWYKEVAPTNMDLNQE